MSQMKRSICNKLSILARESSLDELSHIALNSECWHRNIISSSETTVTHLGDQDSNAANIKTHGDTNDVGDETCKHILLFYKPASKIK